MFRKLKGTKKNLFLKSSVECPTQALKTIAPLDKSTLIDYPFKNADDSGKMYLFLYTSDLVKLEFRKKILDLEEQWVVDLQFLVAAGQLGIILVKYK